MGTHLGGGHPRQGATRALLGPGPIAGMVMTEKKSASYGRANPSLVVKGRW